MLEIPGSGLVPHPSLVQECRDAGGWGTEEPWMGRRRSPGLGPEDRGSVAPRALHGALPHGARFFPLRSQASTPAPVLSDRQGLDLSSQLVAHCPVLLNLHPHSFYRRVVGGLPGWGDYSLG